jgi:hypothetical protein
VAAPDPAIIIPGVGSSFYSDAIGAENTCSANSMTTVVKYPQIDSTRGCTRDTDRTGKSEEGCEEEVNYTQLICGLIVALPFQQAF